MTSRFEIITTSIRPSTVSMICLLGVIESVCDQVPQLLQEQHRLDALRVDQADIERRLRPAGGEDQQRDRDAAPSERESGGKGCFGVKDIQEGSLQGIRIAEGGLYLSTLPCGDNWPQKLAIVEPEAGMRSRAREYGQIQNVARLTGSGF